MARKKTEDRDTAQVLNAILIQSRWHLVMFEHASRMGHGYGYSRGSGMMGGYGYGMGPGMMGGYGCGMGPGMMGYYSPEQYEKQFKEHQDFLDETKELRKKLHTLKFDFVEAQRNPNTKREDLEKMNTEMESIWKQIYEKKKSIVK